MYGELYERVPDVGMYLERIGIVGEEIRAERYWLDRLVHAHLTHVPFEDMDVWGAGECPDLGIKALFEKIVLRRRGGYCFELNSLFNALLKALGFETYLVAAHVTAGRDYLPPPSHCAVVCVICGEKYFCDVGYGGPAPDGGLPLCGAGCRGFHVENDGRWCHVINEKSGGEELRFRDVAVEPVEIVPLNYHVSQNPDSIFRNELHLNLRLEDGSVSVVDSVFKLRRGSERQEKNIEPAELPAILEEYFAIPPAGVSVRPFGPFDK